MVMKINALLLSFALSVAAAPQEEKVENDARFHDLLRTAARSHESYGRVDDFLRFAPAACMDAPSAPLRVSLSKDESTHGRKLYFLYAWDAASYLKDSRRDAFKGRQKPPVYEKKDAAQVLVKQSWTCVEATQKPVTGGDLLRRITLEGKEWTTGEKKALFIMVKVDEKTDGTDRGWVYGTVTPDLKSVTSSGRVRNCMECHEKAGDGRLFGLPKSETK